MFLKVSLGIALIALTACEPGPAAGSAATVRDSSGITIVENGADCTQGSLWRVSAEPLVTIGLSDGSAEYLLDRVAAAFQFRDGRIVVANGGTAEFRFYDRQGEYLGASGGRGEGPGELRVLYRTALLAGDTLVAFDPAAGRADWFDSEGRFIRRSEVSVRGLFQPPYFTEGGSLLPDRTILLRVYEGGTLPPGLHRSRLGFVRYDPTTGVQDTLGWFRALDNFIVEIDGRPFADVPLSPRRTVETWNQETIFIADTDRYEIAAFNPADGRRLLIRCTVPAIKVTSRDRADFEARYRDYMSRSRRPRAHHERWLADVPYPETMAPIVALITDRSGHLWVQEAREPGVGPTHWTIFDEQGSVIAQAELPTGVRPLDIGSEYILGVWHDEDMVEYIHLYSLTTER